LAFPRHEKFVADRLEDRAGLEDESNLGTTAITLQPADNVQSKAGSVSQQNGLKRLSYATRPMAGPIRINTSGAIDFLGDFDQDVATVPRVAP